MQLNQAQVIKNMEANQAQFIKNMELNQEKLIADHVSETSSMQSRLLALEEKHIKEMKIMEFNHSNHLITMEANHEKEMNYMKNCFMTMKADNGKAIKNMEIRQMSLEHKLLTIEESE